MSSSGNLITLTHLRLSHALGLPFVVLTVPSTSCSIDVKKLAESMGLASHSSSGGLQVALKDAAHGRTCLLDWLTPFEELGH